jgi:hypothetical protein
MEEPTLIQLEMDLYQDLPNHMIMLKKTRSYLPKVVDYLRRHPEFDDIYDELIQVALDVGAGTITAAVRKFIKDWDYLFHVEEMNHNYRTMCIEK